MKRMLELEEEEIAFICKLLDEESSNLREAREQIVDAGSISGSEVLTTQMVWVTNVRKKMRIYK